MSAYGIDLGTTYSVIATLNDNGLPEIIENQDDGVRTLASAVYFEPGGSPVVGNTAKEQAASEPDRVVQFVKRQIGKSDAKWEFDGETYDPIKISSLILKRMKEYAEAQGHNVQDVVITCPAYFGNEERIATKQAGMIAGLNVLGVINEPTAAALSYCSREFGENRKIMVYDLGGGTFDVTLLDFSVDANGKNAGIEIIDSNGDDRLGGVDWDNCLYEYICSVYCDENGIDIDDMDEALKREISSKVEGAKKQLSNKDRHNINISYAGQSSRIEVTAEQFAERTKDLVGRTMDFVKRILSENSLTPDDINVVLLVGGSTRMPMIKNAVSEMFPGKVRVEDPDLAVAKGAALSAAMELKEMKRKSGESVPDDSDNSDNTDSTVNQPSELTVPVNIITIDDTLPRSFGPAVWMKDENGEVKFMINNLLFRGDRSPGEKEEEYATMVDNQECVNIPIYENFGKDHAQHEFVVPSYDENGNEQPTDPELKVKKLGEVTLELPPHTPAQSPIRVYFKCSEKGLEVRATNPATGQHVETQIRTENTKTDEEIKRDTQHLASIKTRSDF